MWTSDSYRDGAVYEVVKALDEAQTVGDPDDLNRLAEAVVDALQKKHVDFEGWLLMRGENWRVIEVDHASDDDGYTSFLVVCESNEEDPTDG